MATTRQLVLHDNLLGGVDTSLPAHLLKHGQWRTQHNFRLDPTLAQLPHKVIYDTIGADTVLWLGHLPGLVPGYGKTLLLSPTYLRKLDGTAMNSTAFTTDAEFHRWATVLYNNSLYYSNLLNPIRVCNGSTDSVLDADAPSARYMAVWYDHMVAAHVSYQGSLYPSRLMCSHLYDFSAWEPTATNEADHYDFVEWQQTDYPFTGITGLAKLGAVLWVFTPTAVIPLQYVGLKKVFQVVESAIQLRVGNTYPWTMVPLANVAFFYDGIEKNFFAFDGQQVIPIGEPVRDYIKENLNDDLSLATRMLGYVDVDNREIWWNFPSQDSTGELDLSVVFDYRNRKWFTASNEDVYCFCGGINQKKSVGELEGIVADLAGTVKNLGQEAGSTPRLYGSADGVVYRDETDADAVGDLVEQSDPVLETPDFHYGDILTVKENDQMVLNATWDEDQNPDATVEVKVKGRNFLGTALDWAGETKVGDWTPDLTDAQLTYPAVAGRILRYYFAFHSVRNAKLYAFSDAVLVKKAEK